MELHDSITTIRNQLKESNTKADELISELETLLGHVDKKSEPASKLESVVHQLKQVNTVSVEALDDIKSSLDHLEQQQQQDIQPSALAKDEDQSTPKVNTEHLEVAELKRTQSQSSDSSKSSSLLDTPNPSPSKYVGRKLSTLHSDLSQLENDIDTDSVNWDTSFYYSKQRPPSPGAILTVWLEQLVDTTVSRNSPTSCLLTNNNNLYRLQKEARVRAKRVIKS